MWGAPWLPRGACSAGRCVLALQKEKQSKTALSVLLWSFVGGRSRLRRKGEPMRSKSAESEAMSKTLKKLGFKYVGPTTCYSLMQVM